MFHVVLELDGKIYDLDFGDTPDYLNTESYLKEMFPRMNHTYMLRQIKAVNSQDLYKKNGRRFSYSYFLFNKGNQYPTTPFNKHLIR